MRIAVCIKQVPTREWQPRIDDSKRGVREQDASFEMNEPDAYALEEALRLREKHGGEVVVCTAGPATREPGAARSAGARRRPGHSRRARSPLFDNDRCLRHRGRPRRRRTRGDIRPRAHRPPVRRSGCGTDRRDPGGAVGRASRDHRDGRAAGRDRSRTSCEGEAGAGRRLVSVGGDAAAGAAHHSERDQSAPIRHAEGHHGGQEKGNSQGDAGIAPRGPLERRQPRCSPQDETDADHSRITRRSRQGPDSTN